LQKTLSFSKNIDRPEKIFGGSKKRGKDRPRFYQKGFPVILCGRENLPPDVIGGRSILVLPERYNNEELWAIGKERKN
jgi:hypothetical protein